MSKSIRTISTLFFIILFLFSIPVLSEAQSKRALTHDDYDSWKSISGSKISVDGNWILYMEAPQDGDAFLVVNNLQNNQEYRHIVGHSGEGTTAHRSAKPQFSYDSKFVVFTISPDQEQVNNAKKKKSKKNDKPNNKLGIMNLSGGNVTVVDSVKSFAMPEEASGWLAYLKEAPKKKDDKKDQEKEKAKEEEEEKKEEKKKEKKKDYGTSLVLRTLQNGSETEYKNILNCRFTKDGKYLLYVISSKEKPETDGVYNLSLKDNSITPLITGKGNYKKWNFDKEETVLAFFADHDDYEADEPTFDLYGWKAGDNAAKLWVSHKSTKDFPEGLSVSDKSNISFSNDGKIVQFGIKEIPEPKPEKDTTKVEPAKAKFDLWHWNDPYPQPQQKIMAQRIKNDTWECIYQIKDKKFVQLADKEIPDVNLHSSGKIATAQNNWPYTKKVSYFGRFRDIYVIDIKNGNRTLVKKELFGGASYSPNGKYVSWFEGKDWFVYDIKSKTTKNITTNLNVRFDQEDHDRPEPARSYGSAGWTDDDASILLYDHYDIWEIKPDGSNAQMITEGFGRKNDLSFRYVRLDPDEITINPNDPLLLSTTNVQTRATGFYRDKVKGTTLPEKLIIKDKAFGRRITKAKNADKLMLTRTAFDEFPDIWISDLNLQNTKKITDLGSQLEPFLWGKAELIDFKSSDGKPLKGILIKPDNFDKSKKYPLMVYIYETLHTGFHGFQNPEPRTSINRSYYVSNGYVLWMPDIEYDTGYPGKDALKCVLPGINMLVREGYIDEEAIGIQGHSWGGYQIAYMITQTNIFKAVESGAPVSNMTSAYGGIRWASGMVRQFQYEKTQSRLGASLWEVPMRYIENSPIFWADKVQTPVLMLHNDEDGAVPWYQGIEFMMALRRLGKEAYMFNYNGEAHGLRKRPNQKDFTIRMQEFFDHHLKGAPKPDWMENGIKAWEKEEEKK